MSTNTTPKIGTRDEWLRARLELLEAEKEQTRRADALAAQRRALPWVRVEKPYEFDTPQGTRTLADLFDGRGQLVVYHFMFGTDWEEGCPSCSFWADNFNGIAIHLAHRDTSFTAVSTASLDKLEAYRARMGWTFPWVSSARSDFNTDFCVSSSSTHNFRTLPEPFEEHAGVSAFAMQDGVVFHTYSAYARGLDVFNGAYQLLDLTAKGRDEDGLPHTMAWLSRHDAYRD
ncbi:MAG TPA: DUF899 domain-containing protein [Acidimicrobiia bacterium]|jgi:predicted dithiol-disulfide oxidoreductase (DUF899 family)